MSQNPQCNAAVPPKARCADRVAPPQAGPVLDVVLVLDNLRSAFNVGNIFRLAEATGVRGIVTCGCTATPPHAKLAKTARGCELRVPCRHESRTADAVQALRAAGRRVYGVETVDGARIVWDVRYELPAALVFGNEALGIAPEVLALCDALVELPCVGLKNSINVGNCAAVLLYTLMQQRLGVAESATAPGKAGP